MQILNKHASARYGRKEQTNGFYFHLKRVHKQKGSTIVICKMKFGRIVAVILHHPIYGSVDCAAGELRRIKTLMKIDESTVTTMEWHFKPYRFLPFRSFKTATSERWREREREKRRGIKREIKSPHEILNGKRRTNGGYGAQQRTRSRSFSVASETQ